MTERISESAIERLIQHHADHHQNMGVGPFSNDAARAELAALRESVAALTAQNAEQARRIDEARKALLAWHVVELNECGEDVLPLMEELDEVALYESGDDLLPWAQELRRAWLSAARARSAGCAGSGQMIVCACFELNAVDAPILRGVKSYARAMDWRNADLMNRYFVCFTLDAEPEVSPPRDLFEWAERKAEDVTR